MIIKRLLTFILLIFYLMFFFYCHSPKRSIEPHQRVRGKYDVATANRVARGEKGIILGTSSPTAVNAGIEILKKGGSAADAALATSMAQIVFDIGSVVSFAGILCVVYYDAPTKRVYSMNACFKTVLGENNPLTIPGSGIPSGRGVLVPGFMAGVEALHKRFGKLPISQVFEPAIYYAENGFNISSRAVSSIQEHWRVLSRLPETRKIFLKDNGLYNKFYRTGDLFKQSLLAETLKKVVTLGADYMYKGDWARKFVEIVRQEGGKMTMRDLAEYQVVWDTPNHTTHNGYDVYALCQPSHGSVSLIQDLNLIESANLRSRDHYTQSAESLYYLIKIARAGAALRTFVYSPKIVKSYIPEGDFSYHSRLKKETAQLIWNRIESGEWEAIEREIVQYGWNPSGHSDAVIAIDQEGSVAAVCHTFNQRSWGYVGIFVDGVSVPDSATFQQPRVYQAGPGNHLPDTTNPCLVLKDGLPVLASSCIGSVLHETSLQSIHNVLDFNMTPETVINTPRIQDPNWANFSQNIVRNSFTQGILDHLQSLGQHYNMVSYSGCYWIGVLINQQTGDLYGAVDMGHAQGY